MLPVLLTLLSAPPPACPVHEPVHEPRVERPDVLLVYLDDANDWVGYVGGHPSAATPNIDRLAERGVGFTNAHCFAPLCKPSRTQLLFGQRQHGYRLDEPDPEVPALPEAFAAAGYRVVGGGKVFHGDNEAHFPEYFDPPPAPEPPPRRKHNLLAYEQELGTFDWEPLAARDEAMPDHQLVSWAIERLNDEDERPLLLAVGLQKPHLPWYLPQRWFEAFPEDRIELPATAPDDLDDVPRAALRNGIERSLERTMRRKGLDRQAVQGYLAALAFADFEVGRLLDGLAASPRADRTLVVLLSDHGLHLGEKNHWRKQSLWEDGTRVPLVVAGPGVSNGTCAKPVDLSSVYPTLLGLCGIELPEHVRAVSLAPLLADPAAEWPHVALTLSQGDVALRDERWRFIRYKAGGEELYDHASDPHEWRNLAGDPEFGETLKRLRERLDRELEAW